MVLSAALSGNVWADSKIIINPDNGHSYQRIDTKMTWQNAKTHCENLDGYLATITSEEENQFVYTNLVSPVSGSSWLGGTDESTEGKWQWITGEEWNFSNWNSGEPTSRNKEDYLHFHAQIAWNDVYNSSLYRPICEWNATTLETNISPKDSGTITKSPDKTSYSPNEEVTLTATPAKGYKFKQWQGDASGSEATITIKMNGNQNVTAVFEKEKIEISSKATYDLKSKTLFLKGILVPFLDGFSREETGEKGIFNVQLQEKIKDAFELIPWSINLKAMFEGEDTSGYILYDHETRSVYIPCFKVATIADIGDGIEGKATFYKDVTMKQWNKSYPIFHIKDMTKADSCK